MTEPEVVVRGYAVVPGRPDEAEMGLTVTSLDESADAALSEAASKSRRLETVLDELDVPRSARITTGLTVRQEREYERERWRTKGFRASNEIKVRIDDPSLAGRLMTEATRRAEAQVEGPHGGYGSTTPPGPRRAGRRPPRPGARRRPTRERWDSASVR
jgi:uncharacterized protein YggE